MEKHQKIETKYPGSFQLAVGEKSYQKCGFQVATILELKVKQMNILGRLTRDAEVRTLSDERQVVNFSVAVNDSYKNKNGERITLTEYFSCAYWRTAKIAQFLTKGTLVELQGRVSVNAWIGSDGEAHAGLHFHTKEITLHSGGTQAEQSGPAAKPSRAKSPAKDNADADDDLPF